jgi:predicted phage tail protein
MLRTIHLHGPLSKLLPEKFELDVNNLTELLRGLNSASSEVMPALRKLGEFAIALKSDKGVRFISQDDLGWHFNDAKEVHLATAESGSGAEAAAAVVAFFEVTGTAAKILYAATYVAATIAISYVVGQIAMSLAEKPTTSGSASDERRSFLFDQAVNLQGQGHPVPLLYGRFRAGSVVISSDVVSEKNAIAINDGVSVDKNGTITGNVFENDIDGSTLSLNEFIVNGTSQIPGTTYASANYDVTLLSNGSFTVVAKNDFTGTISIIYKASSPSTAQATATLTVQVNEPYSNYSPGYDSTGP